MDTGSAKETTEFYMLLTIVIEPSEFIGLGIAGMFTDIKMKITTYIDETLLKRALRATGAHSHREVLEIGLRTLLADVRRRRFATKFDAFRLDLSPKVLRQTREGS